MSVRVTCPSCGRSLLAREAALGSRGTCPSCLAEITIPETEQPAPSVQADRPEPRERGPSCPNCGRVVEAIWVTCPWCEEPLRGRHDRSYGRPDLDVRRDRTGTGAALIVLAVLGGLGVLAFGIQAVGALSEGYFQPLISLLVALLFLAGLTTIIVFVRSRGNPGAAGVRRVVVGTLAMAGGIMAGSFCLGVAAFIVVLAVCAAAMSRGHW
jgi:hypothetical protein